MSSFPGTERVVAAMQPPAAQRPEGPDEAMGDDPGTQAPAYGELLELSQTTTLGQRALERMTTTMMTMTMTMTMIMTTMTTGIVPTPS